MSHGSYFWKQGVFINTLWCGGVLSAVQRKISLELFCPQLVHMVSDFFGSLVLGTRWKVLLTSKYIFRKVTYFVLQLVSVLSLLWIMWYRCWWGWIASERAEDGTSDPTLLCVLFCLTSEVTAGLQRSRQMDAASCWFLSFSFPLLLSSMPSSWQWCSPSSSNTSCTPSTSRVRIPGTTRQCTCFTQNSSQVMTLAFLEGNDRKPASVGPCLEHLGQCWWLA